MSEAKRDAAWTWDAYLEWEARQPRRHELVDGQVYAMGGGTAEHDTIGNNLRAALHSQLRGKPCRSHGPDLKVKAGNDGRYPDALVDCGPRLPGAETRMRIGVRGMAAAAIMMLVLALTVGLRVWTLAAPVLVMGFCAGAIYPTLMAKGNSLFPHIAGLTSAILGCALLLVSSAMMGLAGFVSVHVLTPLAVFFVILALTVNVMVTKLLRYLAAPQPATVTPCRSEAA